MARIVDWKVLRTLVPYSRQHLARLEAAGQFPLRVTLGPCRVGWVQEEVEAWIERRMNDRTPPSGAAVDAAE